MPLLWQRSSIICYRYPAWAPPAIKGLASVEAVWQLESSPVCRHVLALVAQLVILVLFFSWKCIPHLASLGGPGRSNQHWKSLQGSAWPCEPGLMLPSIHIKAALADPDPFLVMNNSVHHKKDVQVKSHSCCLFLGTTKRKNMGVGAAG